MFPNLFLSLSGFLFLPCVNDELVSYYVGLIKNETSRAFNIELPTSASEYIPSSMEALDCGTFDHIIIGAGAAGAVAANRLSEDSARQILLLEAGGPETNFSDIPAMMSFLQGLEYNWNYETVPQANACLGLVGNKCKYHSGKGLGGSSLTNGLMYSRGNKQDYDNWSLQGNVDWSYNDVLPFFKKSEKFPSGNLKYNGDNGYLNVEVVEPTSPQAKAFFQANEELGYNLINYNAIEQIGYGKIYLNIDRGKRHSTSRAFLDPIKHRNNLKVLTHAFVTKILIDQKKAYGVEFIRNGKICKARSKHDIVLSTGAIRSPQILMLSGIGPKSHLEQFQIPVIRDLKVGSNLLDHPVLTSLEFTTNYTETNTNLEHNIREFINGGGALKNSFNAQGIAFLETKKNNLTNYPDIEIIMAPSPLNYEVTAKFFNFEKNTYNAVATNGNAMQNFYLILIGLHPSSVGTLELVSKNWYDYPKIDPKFLSDAEGNDLDTLYKGVQLILKLVNTEAFKTLDTKLRYIPLPACDQFEYLSKEYWYCRIKYFANSGYHYAGTCKMGPDPNLGAVVDSHLRVHGISNLRVADASIMPSLISGHTNAPSIMIGERVADFVKSSL
ncbi:hypothetical protein RN001_004156 [Aquatica leii]|uniref:Glucose-methanol-choline oxidoreductase N-terminal domain-containing protein n=1 Tax=Aquatica leii TaxID=1421715 RepID=A0AAN7QC78_9COLE|nr:hypothetical protein RN001_004156 [Aquatica leii]